MASGSRAFVRRLGYQERNAWRRHSMIASTGDLRHRMLHIIEALLNFQTRV